jgi:hypothetical protein
MTAPDRRTRVRRCRPVPGGPGDGPATRLDSAGGPGKPVASNRTRPKPSTNLTTTALTPRDESHNQPAMREKYMADSTRYSDSNPDTADEPVVGPDRGSRPGMPRWVKGVRDHRWRPDPVSSPRHDAHERRPRAWAPRTRAAGTWERARGRGLPRQGQADLAATTNALGSDPDRTELLKISVAPAGGSDISSHWDR